VLTIYDDHGGYGHPDHIQVHRVGRRAAELAGVGRVYQSTMNRTQIQKMIAENREEFVEAIEEDDDIETDEFGTPEAEITHAVDVTAVIGRKRDAMVAHASQIGPDSFFLKMAPDAFALAFGTEWYIELDGERPDGAAFGDDLFAGVG
jgi:LmbE family N-acetylglucosaminyl deacetylase